MQMPQKIFFHNADRSLSIPHKKVLKDCIKKIFVAEGKSLKRLDYIFCSDEYLLRMNKQFLHHDFYTDILTFGLNDMAETVGEIYISLDRVKENAKTHQSAYLDEVARVTAHGALHLCGYKDKTKKDKAAMRTREDSFIALFSSSVSRGTKKAKKGATR